MKRKWIIGGGLTVSVLTLAILLLWPFAGPLRADWTLDGDLMAVVMDWRDFGRNKAETRLGWVLRQRGLERYLTTDACVFNGTDQGVKSITCAWFTTVDVPLYGPVDLHLQSYARVDESGEVVTY